MNKKMNFRFFENPRGEIFSMGKNPRRESEKSLWGNFSPAGRDFDLCRGIFSKSLSQNAVEFPQYGLFYWK